MIDGIILISDVYEDTVNALPIKHCKQQLDLGLRILNALSVSDDDNSLPLSTLGWRHYQFSLVNILMRYTRKLVDSGVNDPNIRIFQDTYSRSRVARDVRPASESWFLHMLNIKRNRSHLNYIAKMETTRMRCRLHLGKFESIKTYINTFDGNPVDQLYAVNSELDRLGILDFPVWYFSRNTTRTYRSKYSATFS